MSRLLWRLHELDPTYLVNPESLGWRVNQDAVADWLLLQQGVLADVARAEIRDMIAISPEIATLERDLAKRVQAAVPTLMELHGCGSLTAAHIIAEVGDINRFKSEAAFARYAGLAPVPQWSGATEGRHRAYHGGNRALNAAIHRIAMGQIMKRGPASSDYRRRRETESHGTAIKRIKRRIARSIYNRLRADLTERPAATSKP